MVKEISVSALWDPYVSYEDGSMCLVTCKWQVVNGERQNISQFVSGNNIYKFMGNRGYMEPCNCAWQLSTHWELSHGRSTRFQALKSKKTLRNPLKIYLYKDKILTWKWNECNAPLGVYKRKTPIVLLCYQIKLRRKNGNDTRNCVCQWGLISVKL